MLREFEAFDSQTQAKKNVVAAIKSVAERLGNTPSVCRKCYVHPAVIDGYMGGEIGKSFEEQVKKALPRGAHALREEELDLLNLLDRRAKLAA